MAKLKINADLTGFFVKYIFLGETFAGAPKAVTITKGEHPGDWRMGFFVAGEQVYLGDDAYPMGEDFVNSLEHWPAIELAHKYLKGKI